MISKMDGTVVLAAEMYVDEGVAVKAHYPFWRSTFAEQKLKVKEADCNYYDVIFAQHTYPTQMHDCHTTATLVRWSNDDNICTSQI